MLEGRGKAGFEAPVATLTGHIQRTVLYDQRSPECQTDGPRLLRMALRKHAVWHM